MEHSQRLTRQYLYERNPKTQRPEGQRLVDMLRRWRDERRRLSSSKV